MPNILRTGRNFILSRCFCAANFTLSRLTAQIEANQVSFELKFFARSVLSWLDHGNTFDLSGSVQGQS